MGEGVAVALALTLPSPETVVGGAAGEEEPERATADHEGVGAAVWGSTPSAART